MLFSCSINLQHQNENFNRDTILGNLSPITGALITADNATYFYTGVQAHYKLGALNLTPSFAPGYYGKYFDFDEILSFVDFS